MKKSNIFILLVILSLMLLGCGVVQTVAEPIDRQGCKADCRACGFSRYEYAAHHCWCVCDGIEIQLY